LHHALESVFRDDHGDSEIVDQTSERGEHLFGRRRVEGGSRLIKNKDSRPGREYRTDGDALLLSTGQSGERAVTQFVKSEEIKHIFYASAHHIRSDTKVLHDMSKFVLDHVGDKASRRILTHEANDVG
jgi:hypothetical protein